MDKLSSVLKANFGVGLSEEFVKKAWYNREMDFLEYVSIDDFTFSERVDTFLTVIWDDEKSKIVGFKLKGIAYVFNELLKPKAGLNDGHFDMLIQALEKCFTAIGDQVIDEANSERRKRAYESTRRLIVQDHVVLPEDLLAA